MLSVDALVPAARSIPRAVGAFAVAVTLPTAITRVRGGMDMSGALLVASLVAGAGVGYAVDDRAARTFSSSPTPLVGRRATRAALTITLLGFAWSVAYALAWTGDADAPTMRSLLPFAAAAAAIAAAYATRLAPDEGASPGLVAAGAALLSMLLIETLSTRFEVLPSLRTEDAAAWWWIAVGGCVLALQASRDPAAPPFRRRRR